MSEFILLPLYIVLQIAFDLNFFVYRSSKNTITTENSYGRQLSALETPQQPLYATLFARHQSDCETPVCCKTPLAYQTPVSVQNKQSSPADTHYYSTADMGNGGCEGYSETACPPNTVEQLLNPMYIIGPAIKSNEAGDHQYSLLTHNQVPSPSHDCQPSNGGDSGHCEQQLCSS